MMLEGAHFLTRERGPEVCQLLRHIILHGASARGERAGPCIVTVSVHSCLFEKQTTM